VAAEEAAVSSALHPHHTSWLNQVERWFALLTQRQIKRGSHRSVSELEAAIREFIAIHNQQPKPFRNPPTRSWPQSPVSLPTLWLPILPELIREINDSGD
jgi:hypothetical protein